MDINNSICTSASIERSIIDDPLNPFFIHHEDNPGMVLVSQLLNGENYTAWSRAMIIALSAKNKLGFIDGSIPTPEGVESFDIDIEKQKVIVKGNVQPDAVLQTVSKTGKATTFWEAEAAAPEPESKPTEPVAVA